MSKTKWEPVGCYNGCYNCHGEGRVLLYSLGGSDFDGVGECVTCGGSGRLFVSPGGALAQYPGGRFQGRITKAEAKP